ncbi:MAG TPA: hypothetical protein VH595_05995 [Verrucomicrobiae bacterium]|jgi:hypothetical protein|nr:hypothetical protein [Verrucomicrobiae bacterium]
MIKTLETPASEFTADELLKLKKNATLPALGQIIADSQLGEARCNTERHKIKIVREDVTKILAGYITAREQDIPVYKAMYGQRKNAPLENLLIAPRIYRDEIRPLLRKEESAMSVIRCANALGALNGVLVTQRCLDFLRWDYPVLRRVSFDFSPEPVQFGQTITTRLTSVPLPGRYDSAAGYANGNAVTTDASFQINTHGFVQIAFSANDLSATKRLLFPEQNEGLHHAMGLDLCTNLFALATPANFPGQIADNSNGFPSSLAVPGTTVVAPDQMSRSSVIAVKSALNQRGATGGIRTLLLTELYHDGLEGDMTMIGNDYSDSADIERVPAVSRLPMVAQFQPLEAPYLPYQNQLQGFGFRADALAIAVRPPADYAKIFKGVDGGGLMELVTNPETGLTVAMALFIDHKLGMAYMRIAYMFGVGVGNKLAGQLITAA